MDSDNSESGDDDNNPQNGQFNEPQITELLTCLQKVINILCQYSNNGTTRKERNFIKKLNRVKKAKVYDEHNEIRKLCNIIKYIGSSHRDNLAEVPTSRSLAEEVAGTSRTQIPAVAGTSISHTEAIPGISRSHTEPAVTEKSASHTIPIVDTPRRHSDSEGARTPKSQTPALAETCRNHTGAVPVISRSLNEALPGPSRSLIDVVPEASESPTYSVSGAPRSNTGAVPGTSTSHSGAVPETPRSLTDAVSETPKSFTDAVTGVSRSHIKAVPNISKNHLEAIAANSRRNVETTDEASSLTDVAPGASRNLTDAVPVISRSLKEAVSGPSRSLIDEVPEASESTTDSVSGAPRSNTGAVPGTSTSHSGAVPETPRSLTDAVPETPKSFTDAVTGVSRSHIKAVPNISKNHLEAIAANSRRNVETTDEASSLTDVAPGASRNLTDAVPVISRSLKEAVPGPSRSLIDEVPEASESTTDSVSGAPRSNTGAVPGTSTSHSGAVPETPRGLTDAVPETPKSFTDAVTGVSRSHIKAVPNISKNHLEAIAANSRRNVETTDEASSLTDVAPGASRNLTDAVPVISRSLKEAVPGPSRSLIDEVPEASESTTDSVSGAPRSNTGAVPRTSSSHSGAVPETTRSLTDAAPETPRSLTDAVNGASRSHIKAVPRTSKNHSEAKAANSRRNVEPTDGASSLTDVAPGASRSLAARVPVSHTETELTNTPKDYTNIGPETPKRHTEKILGPTSHLDLVSVNSRALTNSVHRPSSSHTNPEAIKTQSKDAISILESNSVSVNSEIPKVSATGVTETIKNSMEPVVSGISKCHSVVKLSNTSRNRTSLTECETLRSDKQPTNINVNVSGDDIRQKESNNKKSHETNMNASKNDELNNNMSSPIRNTETSLKRHHANSNRDDLKRPKVDKCSCKSSVNVQQCYTHHETKHNKENYEHNIQELYTSYDNINANEAQNAKEAKEKKSPDAKEIKTTMSESTPNGHVEQATNNSAFAEITDIDILRNQADVQKITASLESIPNQQIEQASAISTLAKITNSDIHNKSNNGTITISNAAPTKIAKTEKRKKSEDGQTTKPQKKMDKSDSTLKSQFEQAISNSTPVKTAEIDKGNVSVGGNKRKTTANDSAPNTRDIELSITNSTPINDKQPADAKKRAKTSLDSMRNERIEETISNSTLTKISDANKAKKTINGKKGKESRIDLGSLKNTYFNIDLTLDNDDDEPKPKAPTRLVKKGSPGPAENDKKNKNVLIIDISEDTSDNQDEENNKIMKVVQELIPKPADNDQVVKNQQVNDVETCYKHSTEEKTANTITKQADVQKKIASSECTSNQPIEQASAISTVAKKNKTDKHNKSTDGMKRTSTENCAQNRHTGETITTITITPAKTAEAKKRKKPNCIKKTQRKSYESDSTPKSQLEHATSNSTRVKTAEIDKDNKSVEGNNTKTTANDSAPKAQIKRAINDSTLTNDKQPADAKKRARTSSDSMRNERIEEKKRKKTLTKISDTNKAKELINGKKRKVAKVEFGSLKNTYATIDLTSDIENEPKASTSAVHKGPGPVEADEKIKDELIIDISRDDFSYEPVEENNKTMVAIQDPVMKTADNDQVLRDQPDHSEDACLYQDNEQKASVKKSNPNTECDDKILNFKQAINIEKFRETNKKINEHRTKLLEELEEKYAQDLLAANVKKERVCKDPEPGSSNTVVVSTFFNAPSNNQKSHHKFSVQNTTHMMQRLKDNCNSSKKRHDKVTHASKRPSEKPKNDKNTLDPNRIVAEVTITPKTTDTFVSTSSTVIPTQQKQKTIQSSSERHTSKAPVILSELSISVRSAPINLSPNLHITSSAIAALIQQSAQIAKPNISITTSTAASEYRTPITESRPGQQNTVTKSSNRASTDSEPCSKRDAHKPRERQTYCIQKKTQMNDDVVLPSNSSEISSVYSKLMQKIAQSDSRSRQTDSSNVTSTSSVYRHTEPRPGKLNPVTNAAKRPSSMPSSKRDTRTKPKEQQTHAVKNNSQINQALPPPIFSAMSAAPMQQSAQISRLGSSNFTSTSAESRPGKPKPVTNAAKRLSKDSMPSPKRDTSTKPKEQPTHAVKNNSQINQALPPPMSAAAMQQSAQISRLGSSNFTSTSAESRPGKPKLVTKASKPPSSDTRPFPKRDAGIKPREEKTNPIQNGVINQAVPAPFEWIPAPLTTLVSQTQQCSSGNKGTSSTNIDVATRKPIKPTPVSPSQNTTHAQQVHSPPRHDWNPSRRESHTNNVQVPQIAWYIPPPLNLTPNQGTSRNMNSNLNANREASIYNDGYPGQSWHTPVPSLVNPEEPAYQRIPTGQPPNHVEEVIPRLRPLLVPRRQEAMMDNQRAPIATQRTWHIPTEPIDI